MVVSRISHTSFDAMDSYSQSLFWAQVLGYVEDPGDPNLPEHDECLIMAPDRSQILLFIRVPDPKRVKNRVHLDIRPVDSSREEEVERVIALGASLYEDHRRPDGSGWITLTDPEGNEFASSGSIRLLLVRRHSLNLVWPLRPVSASAIQPVLGLVGDRSTSVAAPPGVNNKGRHCPGQESDQYQEEDHLHEHRFSADAGADEQDLLATGSVSGLEHPQNDHL